MMQEIQYKDIVPSLEAYLNWLELVISSAMNSYFQDDHLTFEALSQQMPAPNLDAPIDKTILEFDLSAAEVLLVLLAMAPQLRPQMLDIFFTKNTLFDRGFSEFGGIKSERHSGFLPTAETALFLLCGKDLEARMQHRALLLPDHRLFRLQILQSPLRNHEEPEMSFPLLLSDEYKGYFFSGTVPAPEFGPQFPAKKIETQLEWKDLIVADQTRDDLHEIHSWLLNSEKILHEWGLGRAIKPGFRSLFFGPPGTGKSLAACLLGKLTGRDVYRIDLSMVVSKYIGETEKNLSAVFETANEKNWILFFDEADALFGKRTSTSSSNDRHANQEVSYLLQRIEDFPGTVILASNFKNNIDAAFMRRFQSIIPFLKPDENQRLQLWKNIFSTKIPISKSIDFERIAEAYELTGGEIVNIVRYAALQAIDTPGKTVLLEHLLGGIRREITKDGRMFENLSIEE